MFRQRLGRFFALQALFLMLGLGATVAVAALLAAKRDPKAGELKSAEEVKGPDRWALDVSDQVGLTHVRSIRQISPVNPATIASWSVEQVIGPPNTTTHGDISTAWASASSDGTPEEWLEMDYPSAVMPKEVHVYETYNPGALVKVTVFDADGNEVEGWKGVDPSPRQPVVSVSKVPIAVKFPISKLRIYLANDAVSGWNEIDAVGLMGQDGLVRWATAVRASTAYGVSAPPPPPIMSVTNPSPQQLLPAWAPFAEPGPNLAQAMQEERVAAAYGWPFLAFHGWRDVPPGTPGAIGAPGVTGTPGGSGTAIPITTFGSLESGKAVDNLSGGYVASLTSSTAQPLPASAFTPSSGSIQRYTLSVPPPQPPPAPTVIVTPTNATPAMPPVKGVLWPGLLANTVIYGVFLELVVLLNYWHIRRLRQFHRMRRGACIHCGYDIGYDFVAGCPECGWRRNARFAAMHSPMPSMHAGNGHRASTGEFV